MPMHTGTRQRTGQDARSETPIFYEILDRNGIAWQDEDGDAAVPESAPMPSAGH